MKPIPCQYRHMSVTLIEDRHEMVSSGGNILTGGKLLVDALNRKLESSESNPIIIGIEFKDFSFSFIY